MALNRRSRLRPLTAGEILDEAVDLYKHNAMLFFSISALLYIPTLFVDPIIAGESAFMRAQDIKGLSTLLASTLWYLLVMGPVVTGILTFAISESYLGRPAGIRRSLSEMLVWNKIGTILVANLIVVSIAAICLSIPGILAGLGVTMLLSEGSARVGGILVLVLSLVSLVLPAYATSRLALAIPSVVLEQKGAIAAIQRTVQLSSGRAARIFGITFIVMAVTSIVQGIIIAPSSAALAKSLITGEGTSVIVRIFNAVLQTATSAFLMPATPIVTCLLYFDCRIRDEGFDIHVLAEEIQRSEHQKANL